MSRSLKQTCILVCFEYCVERSIRFLLKKRWGGQFLTQVKIAAAVLVFRGFGLLKINFLLALDKLQEWK